MRGRFISKNPDSRFSEVKLGGFSLLTKGSKRKKIKDVSSGPYGDATEKTNKRIKKRDKKGHKKNRGLGGHN